MPQCIAGSVVATHSAMERYLFHGFNSGRALYFETRAQGGASPAKSKLGRVSVDLQDSSTGQKQALKQTSHWRVDVRAATSLTDSCSLHETPGGVHQTKHREQPQSTEQRIWIMRIGTLYKDWKLGPLGTSRYTGEGYGYHKYEYSNGNRYRAIWGTSPEFRGDNLQLAIASIS
ncbi:uncharacterized protein CLUP02_16934 [Colletotrichum lupini]|uniref:Uncharacterized protein n=1 Tax=Colletotrichum lupini TaxID=145971 RepID=A0A9Q8T8V8_9PEZI|nr:uncharacterized protein CLUP02_16934 [Colletotrichum lupini]UQC91399.1 hypothetical protein CLUP02_16934 [Colletotrichum lupini]